MYIHIKICKCNNNNMRMGDKYIQVFSILEIENRWLKYMFYIHGVINYNIIIGNYNKHVR